MNIRPGRITVLLVLVLAASTACAGTRAPSAEAGRLFETLPMGDGVSVADVGAGDGDWTLTLAERVGAGGQVFATEVKEDLVADLRERAEREGLANVTVLLGDDTRLGLPDACCDAIFLRQVYHHFTDPRAMRDGFRRALRPGGVVLVVEIRIQPNWEELDGVPDRGGHGIEPEDLLAEMSADGFELVERYDSWPGDEDRYAMLFRPVPEVEPMALGFF